MVAPCLQGGPRLVAHRLRWGPRSDPCTEHTMNRCEPCAIKQKRTGAAEGPPARVLSKKTPPSCTSKVLPPIEGVGTFTGNGPLAVVTEPRHNRVRYLLHGQIDNLLVRCIFRKICERRRRSNTGVTVGDLWSGFLDKPPTEAHLSDFCFNTNR